jgi:superfamily II DNA or RNA helicase
MILTIKQVDAAWCKVEGGDQHLLDPVLGYKSEVWHRRQCEDGAFRKKPTEVWNRAHSLKTKKFLAGFWPRVEDYVNSKAIDCKYLPAVTPDWFGVYPRIEPERREKIKNILMADGGIVLRDYQIEVLRAIFKHGRGVILSPTGSGKTVMFSTVCMILPQHLNVLVIVPNTTLVTQTKRRFIKYFGRDYVGVISGDQVSPSRLTITNIQKFEKLEESSYHHSIDAVLVDECHHVNLTGTYADVLCRLPNAWMRVGFTATRPYTPVGIMGNEGHLGGCLEEVPIQDLVDNGDLARPILKIKKVPFSRKIQQITKYQDLVSEGIVNNIARNRLILETADDLRKQGLTSLILVVRLEQGELLEKMGKSEYRDTRWNYINGSSEKDIRDKVKRALESGTTDCVIATCIWNEGVDIPSLGAVINGCGGKSEIATVQKIGRGLRKTAAKQKVYLVDFFDQSHKILIDHFGHRVCLYSELGWLGREE